MARIHENTLKWLNEQIKKKHVKNKSNNVVVEEDLKQCIYCHKLFLNATFVMKHIFKRHAEQFLRHHKKFINATKTEIDLDSQSVLVNYLKSEFSNLKTELESLKKAVSHHTYVNDQVKNQVTYPISFQECKSSSEVSNINVLEDKLLSEDLEAENVTRRDFMKLQVKVEELSQMYKEVVSSNEGKEDRICKRLKNELLTDFENLLIRYQEQNLEWKEHFLHLRNDVHRLEQTVELNKEKIESPEVLKVIENKIDQQIESFYANYGIVDRRDRTSLKTTRKVLKDNSLNVHRSNRRKKSIYTCSPQALNLQERPLDTSIIANVQHLQTGLSDTHNAHTSSILKSNNENIQKLVAEKAKILFDDRLKNLSISPKVKQMSGEEYEKKMHLVNAEKELLCQKYTNFQQVYERLDSHANKLVKSLMEKKLRKTRFSDSVPSQASNMKDKANREHMAEKSLLVEKISSGFMQQSEFMHDFGAYGDFKDIEHSSEYVRNLGRSDCDLASEKNQGFKFQEHFVTSPQNLPPSNRFSELKLMDSPNKSSSLKLSNDSLSELSSLESDTNLS